MKIQSCWRLKLDQQKNCLQTCKHTNNHSFLRTASSSAVEFLLETILYIKWCEQRGMMCDWQVEVMPLILHLGCIGEKLFPSNWRVFSAFQPKVFILFACPFFCLFIFTNGIAGFCSPFVQKNYSDLEQTSIGSSCGVFSELCLAELSLASAQGYQLLWWQPARSGEVPPFLFLAMTADVEHIWVPQTCVLSYTISLKFLHCAFMI